MFCYSVLSILRQANTSYNIIGWAQLPQTLSFLTIEFLTQQGCLQNIFVMCLKASPIMSMWQSSLAKHQINHIEFIQKVLHRSRQSVQM